MDFEKRGVVYMMSSEEICKRYSISPQQGELLLEKMRNINTDDETKIISFVTQIIMLSQALEKCGFEPSVAGCKSFTECIPQSTRSLYSTSPVDAAIEYISRTA